MESQKPPNIITSQSSQPSSQPSPPTSDVKLGPGPVFRLQLKNEKEINNCSHPEETEIGVIGGDNSMDLQLALRKLQNLQLEHLLEKQKLSDELASLQKDNIRQCLQFKKKEKKAKEELEAANAKIAQLENDYQQQKQEIERMDAAFQKLQTLTFKELSDFEEILKEVEDEKRAELQNLEKCKNEEIKLAEDKIKELQKEVQKQRKNKVENIVDKLNKSRIPVPLPLPLSSSKKRSEKLTNIEVMRKSKREAMERLKLLREKEVDVKTGTLHLKKVARAPFSSAASFSALQDQTLKNRKRMSLVASATAAGTSTSRERNLPLFSCKSFECNATFSFKFELDLHMVLEHTSCSFGSCQKSFSTKPELLSHLQKEHQKDDSSALKHK